MMMKTKSRAGYLFGALGLLLVAVTLTSCADEATRQYAREVRQTNVASVPASASPALPGGTPMPVNQEPIRQSAEFEKAFGVEGLLFEEDLAPMQVWQRRIEAGAGLSDEDFRKWARPMLAAINLKDRSLDETLDALGKEPHRAAQLVFFDEAFRFAVAPEGERGLGFTAAAGREFAECYYATGGAPGYSFEILIVYRKGYQLARREKSAGGRGLAPEAARAAADEAIGAAVLARLSAPSVSPPR